MPVIRDGGGTPVRVDNPVPQIWVTPNQGTVNIVDTTAVQTISNKVFTGSISTDVKVLASNVAYTSVASLVTLAGMTWTVVAGATYVFESVIPCTMTTNGGISIAFGLTTATLTSAQVLGYISTAADNTTAVSVQSTTAASGTRYIDTKTAAYTYARLNGSFVVNAGGTLALQACQNTSHSDTTTVLLGTYMRLTRTS